MIIVITRDNKTTLENAKSLLGKPFEKMIKFVVDVEKGKIALGGEMHADAEKELLEQGSSQKDLWGANFYPLNPLEQRIEYTSLINIRPSANNLSLEVVSAGLRQRILEIVNELITQ